MLNLAKVNIKSITFTQWIVIFLCGLMFLQSCRKDNVQPNDLEDQIKYSFFVAGHTYGSPSNYIGGIYEPFKSKFNWMNQDTLLKFGVLTGDIVKYATEEYWDLVDDDLIDLKSQVYFAVGNHDITDRPLYEARYGDTFFSFYQTSLEFFDFFRFYGSN